MGPLTQLMLLCFCTFISESRVLSDINAGDSRHRLRLPEHFSLFPGIFPPRYPDDFEIDNFLNWHKTKLNKDQNYQYPSLFNYHKYESTTESTTTEQPPEEVINHDNTEPRKEEIDGSSQDKAKKDEDYKDGNKSEDIMSLKTNVSYMRQTNTKDNKLSRTSDYNAINIGPTDAIALPVASMIVPAISIQSLNQESPILNPVVSKNPAGNNNGYSTPILVTNNNEPANGNDGFRPSVSQAIPLNIPQNAVNNNVQPNTYNIASIPNNAIINNVPNSYYLVSNSQAMPFNNVLQTGSQMFALVPISNLGGNVITNQADIFFNQENQNYDVPNQSNNFVPYNNQRDNLHINQPNNYVPLTNQPNYVTFNNQPASLVPLNNQGNQYVANQPNNIVRFNQPNNMVAVNNNPSSNMLAVGNQPNYIVLNNQPNTVSNQPNNLVALNSGGSTPLIVQAQPRPNLVLYSLKDEDKEDDSEEKVAEMEGKIDEHDNIQPSEEPTETVDA